MTDKKTSPEVISDEALDDVNGGGLLLPAVQKVREAAARAGDGSVKPGDGSVKPITQGTGGNGI